MPAIRCDSTGGKRCISSSGGAASELLATSDDIKREMLDFLHLGGEVSVCLKCLENLNRVEEIKALGSLGNLKVFYVGGFFTKVLKDREHLITV